MLRMCLRSPKKMYSPPPSRARKGETGFTSKEMLTKHLTNLQGPVYFIAGPPTMVAGRRKMLVDAGIDEDDIRTARIWRLLKRARPLSRSGCSNRKKESFRGEQHANKQAENENSS